MNKVLVTGANGFVGRAFCDALEQAGIQPVRGVRGSADFNETAVGDINSATDWSAVLSGCDVVVHLAARVHVMHERDTDPLAAFRAVNTAGTLNLARQSAKFGVRRFVFLSSIKVNGEATISAPFTEADAVQPQDPYALSKWEAEQGLQQIAAATGLEVVVLRPPLIYGPGVKANFRSLLSWVNHRAPLPLAAVDNRRSMLYLGNLVDALLVCAEHPDVAGKTYVLSDGEDISTSDLIGRISAAFGKHPCLWALPEQWLTILARLVGKQAEAGRLLGSLQVDSSRFRHDTGWVPPFTLSQGIQQTVDWYRGECS